MIEGILVAVAAALVAFLLSGARSSAYLFYYLGVIPFITLDASAGGLVESADLAAGNVQFKMGLRVLVSAGFLVLLVRRRACLGQLSRAQSAPVLFFFVWAVFSLQRTQAPLVSFLRLSEFLVFFLGGVVLFVEAARFHPPRTVARWHALALLQLPLTAIFHWFSEPTLAYFEDAQGIGRLGHKFINSNSLGFCAVILTLWATVELREGRERLRSFFHEKGVPLLVLLLGAFVLFSARSRTAMVSSVGGMLLIWFPFAWREARRVALFLGLAALGLGLTWMNFEVIGEWFLRGESAASLESGTGRTGLWSALLREQLPESPILGAGYLMLGADGHFFHAGRPWNNAHNSYLFALISNGVPGLLAVLVIAFLPLVAFGRRVLHTTERERPFWVLLFALQAVVLLASITGFGISGYPNPVMFFHLSLYPFALLHGRSRRRRDERSPWHAGATPRLRALDGGAGA